MGRDRQNVKPGLPGQSGRRPWCEDYLPKCPAERREGLTGCWEERVRAGVELRGSVGRQEPSWRQWVGEEVSPPLED